MQQRAATMQRPAPRIHIAPVPARVLVDNSVLPKFPRSPHFPGREELQLPTPLMHIYTKMENRIARRKRGPRIALARKARAKPFPVIPPQLTPSPSRELSELREYVGSLDAKLCDMVEYLVDTELAEHAQAYSPQELVRTIPRPFVGHASEYLHDLRSDAYELCVEMEEYVELLSKSEKAEEVVDLTLLDD